MNLNIKLEFTEIEGCLMPKKIKDWQEYAKETRELMAREFRMKLFEGNIKDKIEYSRSISPMHYPM